MIRMIGIILEYERLFINNGMALLADVFSQTPGFLPVVTRTAKMPKNREKTVTVINTVKIPSPL